MSLPPEPPDSRRDSVDPATLPPPNPYAKPHPYPQQPYPPQQAWGQRPYGQPPVPVPAWAVARPSALPLEPVEYQHLLRGPRYRWWRPLLTLLLFAALAFAAIVVLTLGVGVAGLATGADMAGYASDITGGDMTPVTFLFTNLTLIVLIPAALLARRIVNGTRPGFLASVAGRIRWRWQLRCLAVTFPLYAVYIGLTTVFTGTRDAHPPYWGALLLVVVLTTPLQCAAEEFAFRGVVLQTVAAWFRRPVVGLVVAAVPAAALFALAHGSTDPWIFAQLSIFALASVFVTWRTGGLEAGIALHCANNVILMFVNILYGGWSSTFIDADTTGDPLSVVIELALQALTVALILWQAKRAGIDRLYRPAEQTSDVSATVLPSPVSAERG